MNQNLPKKERYKKLKADLKRLKWKLVTSFADFKNQREKALLECPKGHRVSMLPYHVLTRANKKEAKYVGQGLGCPKCSGFHKTIEDLQAFAESYGWKCKSKVYKTQRDEYEWICPRGHVVKKTFHYFLKAQCCDKCQSNVYSLKDYQLVSKEKGGELVTHIEKEYSSASLLTFRCSNGHEFRSNYSGALKKWCPCCKIAV